MKQCADTEGTTLLDKTITNARATKDCARKKVKRVERGRYRRRENAYSKIGIYQVGDSMHWEAKLVYSELH
ncbi:hypothetical protein ACS0TY_015980 [Phlomoides rotata]